MRRIVQGGSIRVFFDSNQHLYNRHSEFMWMHWSLYLYRLAETCGIHSGFTKHQWLTIPDQETTAAWPSWE